MTEINTTKNFQTLMPEIVSYWSNMEEILTIDRSSNFYVFIGTFQRGEEKSMRRVGLCFEGYPSSRGRITPLMMPKEASLIFLNGLLIDAIQKNKEEIVTSIINAINVIKKEG